VDLRKGVYTLSNWMHLTIHCVTCEHGANLKFGYLTLLTWFCSWEQFSNNRLNTLRVETNWSWNFRKAMRPLFTDSVTIVVFKLGVTICRYILTTHLRSLSLKYKYLPERAITILNSSLIVLSTSSTPVFPNYTTKNDVFQVWGVCSQKFASFILH